MKFDKVIMNPPYDRNLHLKILETSLSYSDNIVNLSPIRWLQDPLAEYKRNTDFKKFETLRSKIENIEEISITQSQDEFNAHFVCDLGIYKVGNGGWNSYSFHRGKSIIDKVYNKINEIMGMLSFLDKVEKNKIDGWRVRVNEIQPMDPPENRGHIEKWRRWIINPNVKTYVYKDGYTEDGEYWTELGGKGKYSKEVGDPLPLSIKFRTKEEAYNFEKYCKLKLPNALKNLCQTDMHVPLMIFPFWPFYEVEWNDEYFYKAFNLNQEEINLIDQVISEIS